MPNNLAPTETEDIMCVERIGGGVVVKDCVMPMCFKLKRSGPFDFSPAMFYPYKIEEQCEFAP